MVLAAKTLSPVGLRRAAREHATARAARGDRAIATRRAGRACQ
jgi:hypothetical protein